MTYKVLQGDTLYGISKQFGVSVEDIKKNNNLSNNILRVGQILKIPLTNNIDKYIVQKGDTLYSISKKYNISINELKLLNNLNDNNIIPGQIIYISKDNNTNYSNYIVQKGDTLYTISKKYKTTPESVININNLKSNILTIGQVLKVPSSSIDVNNNNLVYTVQKGDTLYSIAEKFGMTVDNIKKLNNLNSNEIYIGQQLLIDKNYISDISIGSSCYGDGFPQEIEYIKYTVKKGDNLYNIAKKYNVSVDSIKKLNNLYTNTIDVGDILIIKEKD